MKKIMLSLTLALLGISQMFALSTSAIRNHARFLSDRMAYELDLSAAQYDDVYEINYDYIYMIDRIMDDVVYGYRDAIDQYYNLLDDRNDDLRYVLTSHQYRRFLDSDYFYRPVYSTGRTWTFRIYTIYSNHAFFYYDAPRHYKVYAGAHSRRVYGRPFYATRYEHQRHDRFGADFRILSSPHRDNLRKHDFGVNVRVRNNNEQNKVNNYKNPNATNRTNNRYYRDNSGNRHSQEINSRNQTNSNRGSSANATSSDNRGSSTTTRSESTTSLGSSSSTNSSTRSTTRSGGRR